LRTVTIGKSILGEMRLCSRSMGKFSDRVLDKQLIQVVVAPNFSGLEEPSNAVPYETFRATFERGKEPTDP
jgi:hypothetical protein